MTSSGLSILKAISQVQKHQWIYGKLEICNLRPEISVLVLLELHGAVIFECKKSEDRHGEKQREKEGTKSLCLLYTSWH